MKITSPALVVLLLPAGYMLGQAPRASHPLPVKASVRLQLSAVAEPIAAKAGQPILLKLRLKNISANVVTVADGNIYAEYDLVVTDLSGKEPPKTKFGQSLPEMPLLRSTSLDIAPGEEVQAELEITKIYDLNLPGAYYARATRRMWAETSEENKVVTEKAFSNPVQFTIAP